MRTEQIVFRLKFDRREAKRRIETFILCHIVDM